MLAAGKMRMSRARANDRDTARSKGAVGAFAASQREMEAGQVLGRWWRSLKVANDTKGKLRQLALRAAQEATRKKLVEICVYAIFLVFFSVSSILVLQDQRLYHLTKFVQGQVVEQEFNEEHSFVMKTFEDIETIDEFHSWLLGPLHATLYTASTVDDANFVDGAVFGMNYLVGGVKVSQLRVRERECSGLHGMRTLSRQVKCYGDPLNKGAWHIDYEDKQPFGQNGITFTWEGNHGDLYSSIADERDTVGAGIGRRSRYANLYPPGAFPVILPNNGSDRGMAAIQKLIDGRYIDMHTRTVFVEFVLYNPMIDFFQHILVLGEQQPTGGMLMTYLPDTLKLYTVVDTTSGWFNVGMEIIVALFFAYFWIIEIANCARGGRKYFFSLNTFLDNLNLVMYMFTWLFRLMMVAVIIPAEDVVIDSDTYYSFHSAVVWKAMAVYATSINAFLCWFKLVRFLAYVPRFALVTGTLRIAGKGVSGFLVVFAVTLYGFAAAHMISLGTRMSGFRNMTQSGYSLVRALLGDFDFEQLEKSQWVMGPLLFILFVAVAVFVVLNVLIAVISDAYTEQQRQLEKSKDVEIGSELASYVYSLAGRVPVIGPLIHKANRKVRKRVKVLKSIRSRNAFKSSRRVQPAAGGGSGKLVPVKEEAKVTTPGGPAARGGDEVVNVKESPRSGAGVRLPELTTPRSGAESKAAAVDMGGVANDPVTVLFAEGSLRMSKRGINHTVL